MILSRQQPMFAPLSSEALRGRGVAMLAFAAFGAWWATSALRPVPWLFRGAGYLLTALIMVALVWASISLFRYGRRVASATAGSSSPRRSTWPIFMLVFLAEIVAINLAALLLGRYDLTSCLIPLIAVIVGLHFYPLARLFHMPIYHITGTAMTVAGAAGVAAIMAGGDAAQSNAAVAAVCALTLWLTAFAAWSASAENRQ